MRINPDRQCERWLYEYLRERGGSAPVRDIRADCRLGRTMLYSAKSALGIRDERVYDETKRGRIGNTHHSVWHLPSEDDQPANDQVAQLTAELAEADQLLAESEDEVEALRQRLAPRQSPTAQRDLAHDNAFLG